MVQWAWGKSIGESWSFLRTRKTRRDRCGSQTRGPPPPEIGVKGPKILTEANKENEGFVAFVIFCLKGLCVESFRKVLKKSYKIPISADGSVGVEVNW